MLVNGKDNESHMLRAIRTLIAACLNALLGARQPEREAADRKCPEETESRELGCYPDRRRGLADDLAVVFFWIGIIFIALMLLLGLAIPALVILGAELLLIDYITRYRAALAGKSNSV